MNACLVFLLLLFLSTCHEKAQGSSPPSGILPTTKWLKRVETPLEISCPDPIDIEPCECTNRGYLAMNCSNAQDEEQLRNIFSAFFPTTDFYEFILYENHGVKVLEDGVFGNVSFQQLNIYGSVLEAVEADALTPSLSTLTEIWIMNCGLEIFPFERLTEFTSLVDLALTSDKIHTLPPLSSSSLKFVDLACNLISQLTSGIFGLLPAINMIYLDNNHLTAIPGGTFTDLPNLSFLDLSSNNISYLQSLAFDFTSTPPGFTLYLQDNNIDYVEVDAFKGLAGPATIRMDNNALIRLPDEVWRPVLKNSITVGLAGNDLACGCDLAWLVRDPQLLTLVTDAHCADGTLLTALNPADFDICG